MNSTNRDLEPKAKVDSISDVTSNSQNNTENEDSNVGISFGGRRLAKKVRISTVITIRRRLSRINTRNQDIQPSNPERYILDRNLILKRILLLLE